MENPKAGGDKVEAMADKRFARLEHRHFSISLLLFGDVVSYFSNIEGREITLNRWQFVVVQKLRFTKIKD